MQKYSLQDNDVLFHMAAQKHTIKIKYKDHPSINVCKNKNFKPLNCNNRYNNCKFHYFVYHIYPIELEIKDTKDSSRSA
jgi:hypothetical protein